MISAGSLVVVPDGGSFEVDVPASEAVIAEDPPHRVRHPADREEHQNAGAPPPGRHDLPPGGQLLGEQPRPAPVAGLRPHHRRAIRDPHQQPALGVLEYSTGPYLSNVVVPPVPDQHRGTSPSSPRSYSVLRQRRR